MNTLIAFLVLAALAGWIVVIYNRLVRFRNRVAAGWSDIDVQLTRRHDLVPRLVEAVKAYAGFEKSTLVAVTELRSRSEATQGLVHKAAVEDKLEVGLHKLILLAEDYPDLKANRNFLELQHDLADIEDHLQYARRFYNGAVRLFNTRIESFPDLLVAGPFGFRQAEFFDIDDDATRAAPTVEIDA